MGSAVVPSFLASLPNYVKPLLYTSRAAITRSPPIRNRPHPALPPPLSTTSLTPDEVITASGRDISADSRDVSEDSRLQSTVPCVSRHTRVRYKETP